MPAQLTLHVDASRRCPIFARCSRQKQDKAKAINKKRGTGFIDVVGVEKAVGKLRSCLHDSVIDGAARVGASIDKDELYQQRPPRRTKNTTVEEIETAECVAKAVALDYVNLAHEKGGPEAALLMGNHTGVLYLNTAVHRDLQL